MPAAGAHQRIDRTALRQVALSTLLGYRDARVWDIPMIPDER